MILFQIIFFTLSYCQENDNFIKEAFIGETYKGMFTQQIPSQQIYSLVEPKIPFHHYLSIVLQFDNEINNMSLYLSKGDTPQFILDQGQQNQCNNDNMEIFPQAIKFCIIDREFLQNEESLQIAVTSNVRCSYTLHIQIYKERSFKLNDIIQLQTSSQQFLQVLNFYINNDKLSVGSEIEILIKQINTDRIQIPFNVFLNQQKQGSPNNYEVLGYDIQKDLKGLGFNYISNKNHYKILILSSEKSAFEIYSLNKNQIISIQLQEEVTTRVQQGQYIQYKLPLEGLKDNCFNFEISAQPFQGTAKLFVNINEQPLQQQQSIWSYIISINTKIEISQAQIQSLQQKLNILYFTIYGEELCTFSFSVNSVCENKIVRYKQLYSNEIFMGYIYPGEIIIPSFISLYTETTIINLNIKQYSGNINFTITNCGTYDKCEFDDEFQMKEPNSQDQYIKVIRASNLNETNYKLVQEYRYNEDQILWDVFIQLDKNCKEVGFYSILFQQQGQLYWLVENAMRQHMIEKGRQQTHIFQVDEINDIKNLSFVITPIQGSAVMQLYHNQTLKGNYIIESRTKEIILDLQIQPGIYYLNFSGDTALQYGILPKVKSSNEQLQQYSQHYIKLYQGVARSLILEKDQFALFQINFLDYFLFVQAYVKLDIDFGSFYLCGSDKLIQNNDDNCQFNVQNNSVIILRPQILENYYIKVKLQDINERGSFKIHYNFQNQNINQLLFLGQPSYFYTHYTEYIKISYLYQADEQILITFNVNDNKSSFLNLNFDENEKIVINRISDSLILVKILSKPLSDCKYIHQNVCQLFTNFTASSIQQMSFSITITSDKDQEFQLYEDIPITKPFPQINHYYFTNINGDEASIILFSKQIGLTIYANLIKDESEPYPNQYNYDKISQQHLFKKYSTIKFSKQDILAKNCYQICSIKLTIINTNSDINLSSEYSLFLNSQYTQMIPKQKYQDQFYDKSVKFYKIFIENDESNLMILINTKNTCKVDLYVTKDHQSNDLTFDWSLKDITEDFILIEAGNKIHPKMSGEYNVAIYGQSGCAYEIEYLQGRFYTQEIKSNSPYEFFIKKGDIMYLYLFNQFDINYQIQLGNNFNGIYYYIDQLEQKLNAFSKEISEFKYNNNSEGYQNNFKLFGTANNYIILKIYCQLSQQILVQVSKEKEQIDLLKNIRLQQELEKNSQQEYSINSSKSITFYIQLYYGSLNLLLSIKINSQYFQNETITLNNAQSMNQYNISYENQSIINIKIFGIERASFNIWYEEQEIKSRIIEPFSPISFILDPMKLILFSFNNYNLPDINKDEKIIILLTSQLLNIQDVSNQHSIQSPELLIYSNDDPNHYIIPTFEQVSNDVIYMEFPDMKSEYQIQIKSYSQFTSTYQLSILNQGVYPIVNNKGNFHVQGNQTSLLHYAIQQNSTNLFYQIHSFYGSYSIYLQDDINALFQDKSQSTKIQVKQLKSNFFFIKVDNQQQSQFLKIKKQTELNDDINEGCYTVKVFEVVNQENIPHNIFFPGNKGIINILSNEIDQSNWSIKISYEPLQIQEDISKNKNYQIQYIEYFFQLNQIEQSDKNQIAKLCSEEYHEETIIQQRYEKLKQITKSFNLSQSFESYQINIIARVYLYSDMNQIISLDYYYMYNVIQKPIEQDIQTNYGIIVAMILLIFLCATLCLCFLSSFIKHKLLLLKIFTNQGHQLETQDNNISA